MESVISTVLVVVVVSLIVGILLVTAGNIFKVHVDEKAAAVRECLPGNNCGACGYPGCDGCSAAIAKGEAPVNACPVGGAPVAAKVAVIMGVEAAPTVKKVAFVRCAGDCDHAVDKSDYYGIRDCRAAAAIPGKSGKACSFGCMGFGTCVEQCQFDAIHIVNGVAFVDRRKCVACGKCVAACPQNLITLVPDNAKWAVQCVSQEKGKAVKDVCSAGCIGCTACTRVCEHDAIHMNGNVAEIDQEKCVQCGKCAEKCPVKIIRIRNLQGKPSVTVG